MLKVSICDKDLQPVQANCQKRLTFTSEVLRLVCIHEPLDWLASIAGAKDKSVVTPFLQHSIASRLLFCVLVCVRVRRVGVGSGGSLCHWLVSILVMYHIKKSQHHRADKWATCVINLLVLMSPLSCF